MWQLNVLGVLEIVVKWSFSLWMEKHFKTFGKHKIMANLIGFASVIWKQKNVS